MPITLAAIEALARNWQSSLDNAIDFVDAAARYAGALPAHILRELKKATGAVNAYFAECDF